MFARWCQENFFQYMKKHYGLDRMIEYGTAPLPDTTKVVNPAWRKLDQTVRRESARLKNLQSKLVSRTLPADTNVEKVQRFERETGQILIEIRAKEGHVKIYLDGAELPAVDLPWAGYFDRTHEPFTRPNLVYTASKRLNNYTPIPFDLLR